ncbi:hypothetical protein BSKO_07338 [Bryopsis sp. KO-2023]|nr:hypothetical protein BSKO_07338 [Bryopsis sp. KO-2023]
MVDDRTCQPVIEVRYSRLKGRLHNTFFFSRNASFRLTGKLKLYRRFPVFTGWGESGGGILLVRPPVFCRGRLACWPQSLHEKKTCLAEDYERGCSEGMDRATVRVVLRVKPQDDSPSEAVTVVDGGETATVIVKKAPTSQELFQFSFSRALENNSQADVYQVCGREVVASSIQGYNGTILAYGQTGSGKTYTMLGPEDALEEQDQLLGIMPRAIQQVFDDLRRGGFLMWSVKLTFVEIYNETFRDLLMPNGKEVTIQDTNQKGSSNITLRGVTRVEVQSEDQAMACLRKGHKGRAVASHFMNDRSSRSHTVLTLWIETTNKDGSLNRSKLNLVDLAGSERLRKTGAEGATAKEATYINKSLSALALVVKELKRKAPHVRYRDSKLTHYLKDSLGGKCRTLMIACIWGDNAHLGETISTCRFADDMQQVEMTAERNTGMDSIHGHLFKLDPVMVKYIDRMTAKRVAEEKAKLYKELKKKGVTDIPEIDADLSPDEYIELEALRAKVKEFELQKCGQANASDDCDQLKEMEILRQRVVELETELDRDSNDVQIREAETALMEEMRALKSRVAQLQKAHSLSAREVDELHALRNRVQLMEQEDMNQRNDKLSTFPSCSSPVFEAELMDDDDPFGTANGDCMEDEEVKRVGRRIPELVLKENTPNDHGLHEGMHTLDKHTLVLNELQQMRDRLKVLHSTTVEKLTRANVDELLEIKDRIISLQTEELKLRALGGGTTTDWTDAETRRDSYSGGEGQHHSRKNNSGASPTSDPALSAVEEVEMLRAENERMRRVLKSRGQSPVPSRSPSPSPQLRSEESKVSQPISPAAPLTPDSSKSATIPAGPLTPIPQGSAFQSESSQPESPGMSCGSPLACHKNKKGLKKSLSARFSKMMNRVKSDRLDQEYVHSGNEETPNIVILNSLTHDQLMELLRAHHATGRFADDRLSDFGEDHPTLLHSAEASTGTLSPERSRQTYPPLSPSASVSSHRPPSCHRSPKRSPKRSSHRSHRTHSPVSEAPRSERHAIVPPLVLSRLP